MLIASISKVFCLLTIKILMNMRNSINYNKLFTTVPPNGIITMNPLRIDQFTLRTNLV